MGGCLRMYMCMPVCVCVVTAVRKQFCSQTCSGMIHLLQSHYGRLWKEAVSRECSEKITKNLPFKDSFVGKIQVSYLYIYYEKLKNPAAGFFLGTEKISQPPLFIGFVTCAVSYSTTCKYTYLIHLISSKFLLFRLIFQ